jgi:mRNA-degrading endonuclease RelE of RelBE toxin-antitoxin system
MSYTYQIHPSVQQDFDEGYTWYEDKQKGLGERFINEVGKKIKELLVNPEANGSRSNKSFREVQVDFFPYLVVYKISKRKKEIYITSIHHMKKHPRKKYRK